MVRVDVPVPLPAEPFPPVLRSVSLDALTLVLLDGLVVGPGGEPLPFASVRCAAIDAAVSAGRDGRFRLPVPAGNDSVHLVVDVAGRLFETDVPASSGAPVVIRCEQEET